MVLSPGAHLGAYEIVALTGAGGMGEVYKARDTRLDRIVAIKVLATSLASDPALRDRFAREARAISALNHPNICTLLDVGHVDGVDYLVLEYLEGETMADRLARVGRLPPGEALKIAIDICDALDQAHRVGIVHRDLKPGNVFLVRRSASAAPVAKLLDFGLAKNTGVPVAIEGVTMQPTTPARLTERGTILGTLHYMAPEQVEGLDADARTDIFAFGALVFEMFCGRPAFEASTPARLLGAILKDEAPLVSRLRPDAPAALDRVVAACLAKHADDRYQTSRDLLRELKWVASDANATPAAETAAPAVKTSRTAWALFALSAIALMAAAIITWRSSSNVTSTAAPLRFTIEPPENVGFGGPLAGGTGSATQVAISPDGRNIVFVAGSSSGYQLWLRSLAAAAATAIPGTEDGSFPFWSPDSRFIGFFAGGKLKKVQVDGGPPIVLCDAPAGRGGTWNSDNVILFMPSSTGGLARVSGAGGTPVDVTTLDPTTGDTSHRWPHFLPDGRHFIYTAVVGTCCPALKPAMVRIGSLDRAGRDVTILQAESSVLYAFGHLLFARDDTLMAQPFDLDVRRPTGEPFPVAEHITIEGSRYVGASISRTGTLAYGQGSSFGSLQLTWVDRAGRVLSTLGETGAFITRANLTLSPDERRVAITLREDIWIIDIARRVRSRQTVDGSVTGASVWSPDGSRIVFGSATAGSVSLLQKPINTRNDEPLLPGSTSPANVAERMTPSDWSEDGRFIAYTDGFPSDIWILPLFGDRRPYPLVQTPSIDREAVFSPDVRWIAYTSFVGGQSNVYVQAFPGGRQNEQVSRDGGSHPMWRADGRELFYLALDGTMMAVPIDTTRSFEAGPPQALFRTNTGLPAFNASRKYAVTKDGKRFLITTRPERATSSPLTVIVNWPATIRKGP